MWLCVADGASQDMSVAEACMQHQQTYEQMHDVHKKMCVI
jgi:hypothetical protein